MTTPNPPAVGQTNWGPTLNNYLSDLQTAETNTATGLANHAANSPADPHGDRAYALQLMAPVMNNINQPGGLVQLNSAGEIPGSLIPAGSGGSGAGVSLDADSADIAALAAAPSAGSVGLAADSGHVHPYTGLLTGTYPGGTETYLRADGTWQTPPGSSSSSGVSSVNAVTGDVVLESTDGTVTLTVSGQDIDLSVNGTSVAVVIPGTGAPSGSTGFDGDYYIDFASLDWYGPKASGAWPASGGNLSSSGGSTFYGGLLGDGSDGSVTFDGTTAYTSFSSLSGSTYTLTRDVYTTSLTVNSGVTVVTNNCTIFCTGTVTNNGTIANNGNNASGATAGTDTTMSNTGIRSLAPGSAGGAGGTGAGTAAANPNPNLTIGGSGGAGGNGSSGNGAAAASAGLGSGTASYFRSPHRMLTPYSAHPLMPYSDSTWPSQPAAYVFGGAPGGSGGGGDDTNSGGGGGGGAGIVLILAYGIVNAGTISAEGGSGATPTTGNCGGGGGGGGGSVFTYSKTAVSGSGTIVTTGGTGGSGVGTGTAGAAGSAGWSLSVVIV